MRNPWLLGIVTKHEESTVKWSLIRAPELRVAHLQEIDLKVGTTVVWRLQFVGANVHHHASPQKSTK